MMAGHPFEKCSNPRMDGSCVRCGRVPEAHKPTGRPRNPVRERELATLAAQAAGVAEQVAVSLHQFADSRAHPGPVRVGPSWKNEAREEAADLCNYLTWWVEDLEPRVAREDDDAIEDRAIALHTLAALMVVWQRLHAR